MYFTSLNSVYLHLMEHSLIVTIKTLIILTSGSSWLASVDCFFPGELITFPCFFVSQVILDPGHFEYCVMRVWVLLKSSGKVLLFLKHIIRVVSKHKICFTFFRWWCQSSFQGFDCAAWCLSHASEMLPGLVPLCTQYAGAPLPTPPAVEQGAGPPFPSPLTSLMRFLSNFCWIRPLQSSPNKANLMS